MVINARHIVTIESFDSSVEVGWGELTRKHEKRFLGLITQHAGWYDALGSCYGEEFPKEWKPFSFPLHGKAWTRPHIKVTLITDKVITKYFDSPEQRDAWKATLDQLLVSIEPVWIDL